MSEIIKGVMFDRGTVEQEGVKKHLTLVGLLVLSDTPLIDGNENEVIVMGAAYLGYELQRLTQYDAPFPLGTLSSAMVSVSEMRPDELEEIIDIHHNSAKVSP